MQFMTSSRVCLQSPVCPSMSHRSASPTAKRARLDNGIARDKVEEALGPCEQSFFAFSVTEGRIGWSVGNCLKTRFSKSARLGDEESLNEVMLDVLTATHQGARLLSDDYASGLQIHASLTKLRMSALAFHWATLLKTRLSLTDPILHDWVPAHLYIQTLVLGFENMEVDARSCVCLKAVGDLHQLLLPACKQNRGRHEYRKEFCGMRDNGERVESICIHCGERL